MNKTHIGELRRARGWTQERLAMESGVAGRTIQRVEAGSDASLDTVALIANALEVPVRALFVSVESIGFGEAVEQLDARKSAQQARRDSITHAFTYLFQGVGILVTFATIVLALTGTISWLGWFIIPAYWAGVRLLFGFLFRIVIDPRLDAKYPLSLPSRAAAND
ncbi:helix-turn-helix domain-containing protein [Cryobacterium sp. TMT1-66-1]|uniref:helix-turn-helix domain-containing protein n=1 Tax=Cryobacterium sp. TMT1-66-1 TaxID=1259242 RepID=UPI00106A1037|nr:helix-turn-helix transcriptional regulator [Cryobacterium sp. TMT1-66-1]TFD09360.1 XRE family transcriptional regulator [Cryobacterium sp. TMT1-66-1]